MGKIKILRLKALGQKGIADPATKANLDRHEILHCDNYRFVASHFRQNDAAKPQNGVTLFLSGFPSPNSEVVAAKIEFKAPDQQLAVPKYSLTGRQIELEMHLDRYEAVSRLLESGTIINAQYRQYSDGQIWADLTCASIALPKHTPAK